MSDFKDHIAEEMESKSFTKEYVNSLAELIANQRKIIERYKRNLEDAVNELRYKCGAYTHEQYGACNGCKWRVVRNGDAG